jgi:serine/threonine protein kinase
VLSLAAGDLDGILSQNGALDEEAIKFFAAQILLGLEFLRSQRIVHLDVKPANILTTSNQQCMSSNFGLSQVQDAEGTMLTGSRGTPGYVAPEVKKFSHTAETSLSPGELQKFQAEW